MKNIPYEKITLAGVVAAFCTAIFILLLVTTWVSTQFHVENADYDAAVLTNTLKTGAIRWGIASVLLWISHKLTLHFRLNNQIHKEN